MLTVDLYQFIRNNFTRSLSSSFQECIQVQVAWYIDQSRHYYVDLIKCPVCFCFVSCWVQASLIQRKMATISWSLVFQIPVQCIAARVDKSKKNWKKSMKWSFREFLRRHLKGFLPEAISLHCFRNLYFHAASHKQIPKMFSFVKVTLESLIIFLWLMSGW